MLWVQALQVAGRGGAGVRVSGQGGSQEGVLLLQHDLVQEAGAVQVASVPEARALVQVSHQRVYIATCHTLDRLTCTVVRS